MTSIKKQILDLRQTTPKHIQWLLLVAAFIVVLILLTLLLGGKKETKIANADDNPINLVFSPDNESINWADTQVGTTKNETVKIFATAPVKIMSVRRTNDIPGFSDPQQTCTGMGQIDTNVSCTIILEYKPTTAHKAETTALFIDWRAVNEPDSMKKTDKIVLVLGADAPTPVEKPAEKPKPKPEPIAVNISEPDEETTTKPIKQEIKQEIESLAPSDPFAESGVQQKPTTAANVASTTDTEGTDTTTQARAEACSDFAFPGYNLSGVQIGWIKPERGAYYFHPFSDKDCDSPTGVYNPDNGIITDIADKGKKIGTDAEHIGYTTISNGTLPQLSNAAPTKNVNRAYQLSSDEIIDGMSGATVGGFGRGGITMNEVPDDTIVGTSGGAIYSTDPFDRTFVLRQYKPIPATIVSEVRADPSLYSNGMISLPVRATVDRNVYSDNGRTVIIPAGTLLLGYVNGEIPGPYKSIGRMNISWYQFVLPNGVEFNFTGDPNADPFSGDSQGRQGVPGYGSTDYIEQFVMPMLTAIVPAAVNLIAPISDTFINQIDLDNNTVVQSGTVRSSELAKNEIITAWNQVAQKLLVDMMENTVPPFSIAAGTRITVYAPDDLVITCGQDDTKKCSMANLKKSTGLASSTRPKWRHQGTVDYSDGSWTGQVRSFNMANWCEPDKNGVYKAKTDKQTLADIRAAGYSFSTVEFYCKSSNYKAINNAKQDALYQNQQQQFQSNYDVSNTGTGITGISGDQKYNEEVLGLNYNEDGSIVNPFQTLPQEQAPAAAVITCEDGSNPDENGCCTGEIYTDMGEQGFNCCPETGGDCFPPIL